jgi:CRISPR-associated protein Cmr6
LKHGCKKTSQANLRSFRESSIKTRIETCITLHPLYGFPYLPGSGLKGLARAYAEIALETKPSGDELREIFGSEDKDPRHAANNRQGKVFFMDGLPTTFPELDLDIMNPHYGNYYRGEKDNKGNLIPPADYLNPVPVTFLTVAADQPFSFAVFSRDRDLSEKATQWLIGGLTELGAGGKTNVGYGYFRIDSPAVQTEKIEPAGIQEDNSLTARPKTVRNQQTFSDFIKGIKPDEIELLKSISFKGMESAINIGIIPALESSEVSTDIKKVIAEKMLEVCKRPENKYAEKLDKYNKLLLMAGKEIK